MTNATVRGIPPELTKLEGMIGDFIAYWGFKRIHGRIWTHLFLSETPLDTAELMRRLQVSKGLMSIALRELLAYNVIQETGTGRHGTVFYRANPDMSGVILGVLRQRELAMLVATRSTCETMKEMHSPQFTSIVSRERMAELTEMTSTAEILLKTFLKQYSKTTEPDFCQVLQSIQVSQ